MPLPRALRRLLALALPPLLVVMVPAMFALGYGLQRLVINRASHGKDENILLVTLGLSIVLENLALLLFKSDTRTIDTAYTLTTVPIGPAMISLPKVVAFFGALATSAALLWIMKRTDLGRAIRAVAKEKQGARLMVVMNGKRRALTITGIALSPEFIYALGPGEMMPDPRRFGVVWLPRPALEQAYDLKGAFSNLVLRLAPGLSEPRVIAALDRITAPFGGSLSRLHSEARP